MITPFPWASGLNRSPDLRLPIGAQIGITTRYEEVDKIDLRRSLNGTGVPLLPLHGVIYRISISASGPAIRWTPAFSRLRKGVIYRIASTEHLDFEIAPGGTQAVLHREPVPGTVFARYGADFAERRLKLSVQGRVVTLDQPAEAWVDGRFLAFHDVYLTERGHSSAEITGLREWTMVFEEAHP